MSMNFSFLDFMILRLILISFLISLILFGLVEDNGFEPLTPCVQGRCSSQLS